MTKSMNPLKLYVYQSLGVPVVASKLHGLELLKGKQLYIAEKESDFIPLIEKGTHAEKAPVVQNQSENTWDSKVKQ